VPLARAVVAGTVDRGVAICGSGVGASVCANKLKGIRAALIHDHFSARQGVEEASQDAVRNPRVREAPLIPNVAARPG